MCYGRAKSLGCALLETGLSFRRWSYRYDSQCFAIEQVTTNTLTMLTASEGPTEVFRGFDGVSKDISVDDIFIPVTGVTGAGKTSFISTCINNKPVPRRSTLSSDTLKISLHSTTCDGRNVHLIDTPGFNDTYRSDAETLQELVYWLVRAFQNGIKISGIIFLHNITTTRVQGSDVKALEIIKAICGETSYSAITLATTRWEQVNEEKGKVRQQELCNNSRFWGDMVKEGAHVTALSSGRPSALRLIKRIVAQDRRFVLDLQREMIHDGKALHETEAGKLVHDKVMSEQIELDQRMQQAKLDFQKAASEFHDRRMIDAKKAMTDISSELEMANAQLSELKMDSTSLQETWDKRISDELQELKRRLDENNREYANKTKALETSRNSPTHSPFLERQYKDDLRKIKKQKNDIEVIQRQHFRTHGGGTATLSTVIGTGLALGQFIAMLACTVM